ncbi:hypothetical protein Esti_000153 [Eimeria stiedai]
MLSPSERMRLLALLLLPVVCLAEEPPAADTINLLHARAAVAKTREAAAAPSSESAAAPTTAFPRQAAQAAPNGTFNQPQSNTRQHGTPVEAKQQKHQQQHEQEKQQHQEEQEQRQQQQQQQQRDFSVLWLTDIHLDHLYNASAPVRVFCHLPYSRHAAIAGSQWALGGGPSLLQQQQQPMYVQARRLAELTSSRRSRIEPRVQHHRGPPLSTGQMHAKAAADAPPEAAAPAAVAGRGIVQMAHAGETDPMLGRAGCDSPPALVDTALQFASSLVTPAVAAAPVVFAAESSKGRGDAGGGLSMLLPPAAAVLLTGDYAAHFSEGQACPCCSYSHLCCCCCCRREALRRWTAALFRQFPQPCDAAVAKGEESRGTQQQQQQKQHQDGDGGGCMQLLLVVGNNDLSADYLIPAARSEWTSFLFSLWGKALPSDAESKQSFIKGLYYAAALRKHPGVVVLCLNTVLYSVAARKRLVDAGFTLAGLTAAEEKDPAGQFAWMREQLQRAREQQTQVVIAGHIPPGFDSHLMPQFSEEDLWVSRYTLIYRSLVSEFSNLVVAQVFGHIHFGRIRALIPEPDSIAAQGAVPTALLGAPALSPIHGNNPAMAALVLTEKAVGRQTNNEGQVALADYVQYSLPLYGFVGAAGRGGVKPRFSLEFSISEAFSPFMSAGSSPATKAATGELQKQEKLQCIDGPLAIKLGEALRLSPMAYALYDWHAAAGGLRISSRVRSCEVLALTWKEHKECLRRADLQ